MLDLIEIEITTDASGDADVVSEDPVSGHVVGIAINQGDIADTVVLTITCVCPAAIAPIPVLTAYTPVTAVDEWVYPRAPMDGMAGATLAAVESGLIPVYGKLRAVVATGGATKTMKAVVLIDRG